MKKTRIMSAAIALSMSLACLPAMASAASENLVTDGSFEFYEPTANGWTSGGRADGGRRGNYCMAMEGWAFKTVTGLEPNTDYRLVGYIKGDTGDARIGVNEYGGDETQNIITSTEFSRQEVRFHTGASNTSARIFVGASGGAVYADDISVTKLQPGESLLINSDCEDSKAPISGASITNNTANVHTGKGAMQISGWPSQVFGPLEANTTYSLSAWVKAPEGDGYMKASSYDKTGDEGTMTGIGKCDEFKFINLFFTTDSTNLSPRIWFGCNTGTIYVDDICLTKLVNCDNLLLDNNFERGKVSFGDPAYADTTKPYTGDYCLAVPSGWPMCGVSLEANTRYVFSGYYCQPAGAVLLPTVKVDGVDNQIWVEKDTNNQYRKFEVYFTTGANTTGGEIYLGKAGADAITYVDDLCLKKLGSEDNMVNYGECELPYNVNVGWTDGDLTDAQAHSGASARVNGNDHWCFYAVTGLEPNTLYEYSLWIKNEVDGDFTYYGVKGYEADGTDSLKATAAESGWKQSKMYFKTGANNTSAEIYTGKSGAQGAAYIDDIVVKKANVSLNGDIKVYSSGVTETNEITDIKLKDGNIWIKADMTDYDTNYDKNLDIYAAVYYDGSLEKLEKADLDDLWTYGDGTKDILFNINIDATDKDIDKYELKVMSWANLMSPRADVVRVASTIE